MKPPSTFDFGDWFSRKKEYYRIETASGFFWDMGLAAFNSGNLIEVLKEEKSICIVGQETVWDHPVSYDDAYASGVLNYILDGPHTKSPYFTTPVNNSRGVTKTRTLSHGEVAPHLDTNDLRGLIKLNNDLLTKPSTDPAFVGTYAVKKDIINDVHTATETSGVTWTVELSFLFGTLETDGAKCTKTAEVDFCMQLFDYDNVHSEKRFAALRVGKNQPFAMVPHTATGKSGKSGPEPGTMEAQRATENIVVGELDLTYNSNTGKIEAGTRTMKAVMLTEAPKANLQSVDIENIHATDMKDLAIDVNSVSYMGNYTLARVLPIQVFNGNPNTVGPTLKDSNCPEEGNKKEILVAVNRSNRTYKKGEFVLINYIDGEWLISPLGDPEDEVNAGTFELGKWGPITYMMSNSDGYFKGFVPPLPPDLIASPGTYELHFYYSFHTDLATQTILDSTLNPLALYSGIQSIPVHPSEFTPSKKYWQYTSFDMLSANLGGKSYVYNLLATTNAHIQADGQPMSEAQKVSQIYPFSGMNFPDGYVSNKRLKIEGFVNNDHRSLPMTASLSMSASTYFEDSMLDPFDNRQAQVSGPNLHASQSMFSSETKDSKQLPADVALNASPSGEFGTPLESLAFMKAKLNFGPGSTSLINGIQDYLGGGTAYHTASTFNGGEAQFRHFWLAEKAFDNPDNYYNGDTSLYDYEPNNPKRVSFIPMTAELLGSHDYPNGVWLESDTKLKQLDNPREMTFDPILPNSYSLFGTTFLGREDYGTLTTRDGNRIIPYYDTIERHNYHTYLSNYMGWGGTHHVDGPYLGVDVDGTFAVSIITAKLRITTGGNTIGFDVQQSVGANRFVYTIGGIPPTTNYSPRWGDDGFDTIHGFNVSPLFVKVYDAWPEKQTIFDPRYFAVMHFNAGMIDESPTSVWNSGGQPVTNADGEVITNSANLPAPISYAYTPIADSYGYYSVNNLDYNIDFRVPTFSGIAGSDGFALAGTRVFGDRTYDPALGSPLRFKKDWRINTIRRGMLLPFSHYRRTIIVFNHFAISAAGKGYEVDDTFKTSGGHGTGVIVKVTQVAGPPTAPTDPPEGAILAVEVTDFGAGFAGEDFPKYGWTLANDGAAPMQLSPISAHGQGAKIYVLEGIVKDIKYEDKAPNTQDSMTQLSINSADGLNADTNGYARGNRSTSISLTKGENPDPDLNYKYDLFFHFHSDTSYVLESDWSSLVPPYHQYITMTINPSL